MSDPLNIAMVAACPFPTSQGSQVLIRELSEALQRRGHRVHLVAYHFGEHLECPGLTIHRIPATFRYGKFRSGPEIRKPLLDLLLALKLDQVVQRENIQIIHAHNYEAPVAALPSCVLRRIPLVYHSHNTMSDEFYTYFRLKIPQALARGAAHLMDRFIPRRADFVIAINPQVEQYLIRHGVPRSRIRFIPPGIDYGAPATPDRSLRDQLELGDGPLILYDGNLDGYQRLDLLLQALPAVFRCHPTARLVVLTGSDSALVMQQARALGISERISIIERPTFERVKEIMALSAVAVNPRISWSGFPIKLLNYMAAGLPVVAFQGAAEPVVEGLTGRLIPSGDCAAFAAALADLLDDPAAARRMGLEGRRIALSRYNWDAIGARIENVYYQLLGFVPSMPLKSLEEHEEVGKAS